MKKLMLLTAVMAVGSVVGSENLTYMESPLKRFLNLLRLTTPAQKLFDNSVLYHCSDKGIAMNKKDLLDQCDEAIKQGIRNGGLDVTTTFTYEIEKEKISKEKISHVFKLYNPNYIRTGLATAVGCTLLATIMSQSHDVCIDDQKKMFVVGVITAISAGIATNQLLKNFDTASVRELIKKTNYRSLFYT